MSRNPGFLSRAGRSRGVAQFWLALGLIAVVPLDGTEGQTASQSSTFTVTGRVINALTGTPIPRVLVNLNSRAVLTDSLGRFEFPDFSASSGGTSGTVSAYVQLTKPGYAAALDANEASSQQQVPDVTVPLELKLYPDALVTGTVTGSDGQPLSRAQVGIARESGEEAGHRIFPAATTMTDSHGEYRFVEPPGHYRVTLRYEARSSDTGEAILPEHFPQETAGDTPATFALGPGDQRKIDFQAHTGPAYPVTFHVETEGDRPMNLRITARSSGGSGFTVFARASRTPGEYTIELPSGTFQLHAAQQDRERRLEADSRVTVSGHPVSGLTLHFAEIPSIPIQVTADVSTASGTPASASSTGGGQVPTPQALNLRLQQVGYTDDGGVSDVRASTLPDKSFVFQAGSGVYHLMAQSGGWFVEKATYGNADLLRQNLTIASGAGGEPIQVTVSNATGQVSGTVRSSGAPGLGFVYLLPHEPDLNPVYTARTGPDGTYSQRLPPGTYTAIAFDHRFPGDLTAKSTALAGSVNAEVTAGGSASADLELQHVERLP